MTTPLPAGMAPYVSPAVLTAAPTGIDWTTIPADDSSTPLDNAAAVWDIANRATGRADGYCNQPLRATADDELVYGPDFRLTCGPAAGGAPLSPWWWNQGPRNARVILSRWPVLAVTKVQTCPASLWPRAWTVLPAGFYEPETPPLPVYGTVSPGGGADGGQAVIIGGGYVDWSYGRNGWAVLVSYLNGWPHCSLTAPAQAGATTVAVDDCTGWAVASYYGTATGATGRVADSGAQEAARVTAATVTAGPGTLTLAAPLGYAHPAGTLLTTLPPAVEQACIFFAAAEALTRGATSTTIHSVGGAAQSSSAGADGLVKQAERLLAPFRRTI